MASRVAGTTFETRFKACVDKVANNALTALDKQRAQAGSAASAVPSSIKVPEAQSGLVALAMFHNPVERGVDPFCDAVGKAIDSRLQARGSKGHAIVSFLDDGRHTLLVSLGHLLEPGRRGATVAMELPPARPAPAKTRDDGAIEAISLVGIVDRLKPHLRCIASCVTAVEQQFPPEQMQEELGITRERLRAFNHGKLFLPPPEARALLRKVASAVVDQDYPIIARGTCIAEARALVDALADEAIFSR